MLIYQTKNVSAAQKSSWERWLQITVDTRTDIWPVLRVILGKMTTDHCRHTDGHLTGFTSHLGKDDYKSL